MHQQNFKNMDFFEEYASNTIVVPLNTPRPLSEKIFQINSILFDFSQKKCVSGPFWPKFNFLLGGRFGYKKASKIKKFLHQQNLQNLSFLTHKKSFKNLF